MAEIRIAKSPDDLSKYKSEIITLLYENLALNLPEEGWDMEDAFAQVSSLLLNIAEGNAQFFLAEEEGHLVGFAWTYRRRVGKRNRLHINHIIIRSGRRNEGTGTKLLNAIISKAREMKVDSIDLMSSKTRENVVRFYSRNGFSVERLQMVLKL